jgi:hypothetical protein
MGDARPPPSEGGRHFSLAGPLDHIRWECLPVETVRGRDRMALPSRYSPESCESHPLEVHLTALHRLRNQGCEKFASFLPAQTQGGFSRRICGLRQP